MLARLFSIGAQYAAGNISRAASPPSSRLVPVTLNAARRVQHAARGCSLPDDSGIEEERAGGGLDTDPPIRAERARSAGLIYGGGTQLHIVEVVMAPRQPTRVPQLCWMRVWRIANLQ